MKVWCLLDEDLTYTEGLKVCIMIPNSLWVSEGMIWETSSMSFQHWLILFYINFGLQWKSRYMNLILQGKGERFRQNDLFQDYQMTEQTIFINKYFICRIVQDEVSMTLNSVVTCIQTFLILRSEFFQSIYQFN